MMTKGFYLIYLIINSIFVLKYTSELEQFNEYLFVSVYVFFMILLPFSYLKLNLKSDYYKYAFFITALGFFFFTIFLNNYVDGNTLTVDRWSAMDVGVNALLNGEYPYSAIDHVGGRTSNLPTLLFIGTPFHLLGDVGYLQTFSFLIFIFILYKVFKSYRTRLFGLILLISSPSYLWEIYVKSDLMSNFIIILLFLIVYANFKKNKTKDISLLSFLSTSLVLTRLTAIIPISLLLFKKFYHYTIKEKIIFLGVAVLTTAIFIYICFHNVDSLEHFKLHNPFELQNRQLPIAISIITILIPLIYSFYIDDFKKLINASVIFLFTPIVIAFMLNIFRNGIHNSIFNSRFDISYFNIVLPFLLIAITYSLLSTEGTAMETDN